MLKIAIFMSFFMLLEQFLILIKKLTHFDQKCPYLIENVPILIENGPVVIVNQNHGLIGIRTGPQIFNRMSIGIRA